MAYLPDFLSEDDLHFFFPSFSLVDRRERFVSPHKASETGTLPSNPSIGNRQGERPKKVRNCDLGVPILHQETSELLFTAFRLFLSNQVLRPTRLFASRFSYLKNSPSRTLAPKASFALEASDLQEEHLVDKSSTAKSIHSQSFSTRAARRRRLSHRTCHQLQVLTSESSKSLSGRRKALLEQSSELSSKKHKTS